MNYPKISIITPSYNQGQFLEETILSVIGQMYPNLEYLIIDGGSTDDTVNVIKKYERYLSYWVSEPDGGQSHAINKGFSKATGDILAWLNSDDLYMPGVLFEMASHYVQTGDAIYFGEAIHFNQRGTHLDAYGSKVIEMSKTNKLSTIDYVIQPSSFWTSNIWKQLGVLREDMHFGFDWEWFLRAEKVGVRMITVPSCISMYRIHATHKTGSGGTKRQLELLRIYEEYDKRMADLFQIVMMERLSPKTRIIKVFLMTLWVFKWNLNFGHIVKYVKYFKYRNFTAREINNCFEMLLVYQ